MKKTAKKLTGKNVIGRRVRQARLKTSPQISQEDLSGRLAAQNIQIDRSGISRIESGTRYVMDFEAIALARALKVGIGWLMSGQD
jgi:HTH-type transcriptional regulator, cell division transcriptional repressor